MPPGDIALSLIVPAYNEAARIGGPLAEMSAFLEGLPQACEIVVIDDGSSDGTAAIVREVAASLPTPVRLIEYEENRGKGYALKVGFEHAQGDHLLFTDCDLSTPIEEAHRLLAVLEEGHDIAIGSRKMEGASIERHQPWIRESLGKVFTYIVQRLIYPVSDVTCGFKAYRREVGRDLFSRVRVFDWSFDAEVLLIARRRGYSLREVPVRWQDRDGTKVNLLRDVTKSLAGLARIRLNDLRGRYAEPVPIGATREEWVAGVGPGSARAASGPL